MLYRVLSSIGVLVGSFFLLFFSTGTLQILTHLFTLLLLTSLLLVFLMSLRVGKTPIITRYSLLMNAEGSVSERKYTRIVTWFWAMFFFVLWLFKVGGLWRFDQTVGLVEGLFYIGSAALFVGEFYVRQLFLPAHRGSVLWRFLYQLSQVSVKEIWQFDHKK